MTTFTIRLPIIAFGAALALAGCEETMTPPSSTAMTGTPEEKCSAEVASRSGSTRLSVTSSQAGESGTVVSIAESGSEHWTCIVSEAGVVAEVFRNKDGRR